MKRSGVIQRFDLADGLGDILLDDGSTVRFGINSLKEFRSVAPEAGTRVIVGETAPGFRGVVRAKEVYLAEESWDETWHVYGLDSPRVIDVEIPRKRVRLVPFSMSAFPRLAEALRKNDVDARSFSNAAPTKPQQPHGVVESLVPLVSPHARRALGFTRVLGEPAVGSTFLGGSYADLGAGDWPVVGGAPLKHVLQIDRQHAAALGLDCQINIFTGEQAAESLDTPMLNALGMAPLFGAVPRGDSPFLVVPGEGGTRRASQTCSTPAIALGEGKSRVVFPSTMLFHSREEAIQSEVAAFFTRVYVVNPEGYAFAPDLAMTSVQAFYGQTFPSADDLVDDVVLGGIAPPLHREVSPRRRLASILLERFPEVREVIAHGDEWLDGDGDFYWRRWALDWSPDSSPQSWAYGC